MSFYAKYHSIDNKPLVGEGRTPRFECRIDAEALLRQTIKINGDHCEGTIIKTGQYPEIFAHCKGFPPQTIGGECFGCQKLLTIIDAKKNARARKIFDKVLKTLLKNYPQLKNQETVRQLWMLIYVPDTGNDRNDCKTTIAIAEQLLEKIEWN